MLFCFYGICFLFQLVNVQCINDSGMNSEIGGTVDEVDWPKIGSKYFDLQDYHDYLEGKVGEKQADPDVKKLRAMLKEISYTQNFSNAAESFEDFTAGTDTIDIRSNLNEVNFVKYKPTVTVDLQNILNEVELNKDKPFEIVVKNIQKRTLDEINNEETVPIDIQSILSESGFRKRNLDEVNPEETVPFDIQSILSKVGFERRNLDEINTEEAVPIDIQSILSKVGFERRNLDEINTETVLIDIQSILSKDSFSKYQPIETVTMDVQNILNEDEFNENIPLETVVKDINRMNLDGMEFNKYQPAETVTMDIQSGILNYNEDIHVETITIVLPIDTPNQYSSYRRTAGLIGFIIALILAPFIIYQRCNAKKELKLRVFVIKRKSEKNEPLISV